MLQLSTEPSFVPRRPWQTRIFFTGVSVCVSQDHYNIRLLEPQQFEAAESLQEECKDFLDST